MNRYTHKFAVTCPSNGEVILYDLEIEAKHLIRVEDILRICQGSQYHEEMADTLAALGGKQVMRAVHHGVLIESFRG